MYAFNAESVDTDNPWRFSEMPVQDFNEHMKEVLSPSWNIGPDESMAWTDIAEGTAPDQIPHAAFVPRKPKPRGAELEDTADAASGCIIRLEIHKGSKVMADADYTDEYPSKTGAGTSAAATNLRFSEPWHKSKLS